MTPLYTGGNIQPLCTFCPCTSDTSTGTVVLAVAYNRARREGGSAAGAVLPLPPAVLPLGVEQPEEEAEVEEGSAVVPLGAVLPLLTASLLPPEGQSNPEDKNKRYSLR